ncbi:hypothetical protein CE91St41_32700 [Oscillospiraceae bacterium]|nr:hypothetical protein CE91St41_32700 [Oscillospiraceae bacterium]
MGNPIAAPGLSKTYIIVILGAGPDQGACTRDAAKAEKAACHCEEAQRGRRGNPFPFLEARPPAAGFFACKEPREETTRACGPWTRGPAAVRFRWLAKPVSAQSSVRSGT